MTSKSKKHVLLIDDDPPLKAGLKQLLETEGYKVSAVSSADEALKCLNSSIKLIVTDYKMPGLSGLDLLKEVKSKYPNLPVIVYSGMGEKEAKLQALELGASDYIEKPFKPETLFEAMEKALNQK